MILIKKEYYTSLWIILIAHSLLSGQSFEFKEVKTPTFLSTEKSNLLYFHFENCPPCKKMDSEVLSDSVFISKLCANYNCISVFGFDSLQTEIRNMFDVNANPAFLIVDKTFKEIHRFVGFHSEKEFIDELAVAKSNNNLSSLDKIYKNGNRTESFMKNYVRRKENANQLDSTIIFEYLSTINYNDISSLSITQKYDLIHYGFHYGNRFIKYDSNYFNVLKKLHKVSTDQNEKEYLRNRILFVINEKYWQINTLKEKRDLIKMMSNFDNGGINMIKDVNYESIYALIPEKYYSFHLFMEVYAENRINPSNEELDHYFSKVEHKPDVINSIAWDIYKDVYNLSDEIGIWLIEGAIEKEESYYYLDTYAHLLSKNSDYNKAKVIAIKAIKLAKQQEIDHSLTSELLKSIEEITDDNK